MILYHGSDIEPDTILSEGLTTGNNIRNEELYEVLERNRPEGFPKRSESIFFTSDMGATGAAYKYIYKVRAKDLNREHLYCAPRGIIDSVVFEMDLEGWNMSTEVDLDELSARYWENVETGVSRDPQWEMFYADPPIDSSLISVINS